MKLDAASARLQSVPVELIVRNPENPRIFFRQKELDDLQNSIRQHGIQVPISVYHDNERYVLIDGERRWRCALKLNLKSIPALVQPAPDPLTNVLLMFNIHALREQWDLLTIAKKLPDVIDMLAQELGRLPTEAEISSRSGLSRSVIRRSKLLIGLPKRYWEMLLAELKKPKPQQKLTEDFFIEMEKALKTVENVLPDLISNKNDARDVLIEKYRDGTVKDLVDLRYLPKIAKAENVGVKKTLAIKSLNRVLTSNTYSLLQAYEDTVADAYSEKTLLSRVWVIVDRLEELGPDNIDENLHEALGALRKKIQELLSRSR